MIVSAIIIVLFNSCAKNIDRDALNTTISSDGILQNMSTLRPVDTVHLSVGRYHLAAAGAGNKILFGGGNALNNGQWTYYATVDVFDVNTLNHQVKYLSSARSNLAAAAAGNKIVFAGGRSASGTPQKTVDIYNVTTNTWSIAQLSEARYDLVATALGSKIFFAGGYNSDELSSYSRRVDIYDVNTNIWTTTKLSVKRTELHAAATNNKVVFAGEPISGSLSNTVDIYDVANNTWSTAALSSIRLGMSAAAAQDKIIFAGGFDPQDLGGNSLTPLSTMDIYNTNSNTWSTGQLPRAKISMGGGTMGIMAVFAGGYLGSNNTYSGSVDYLSGNMDFFDVRIKLSVSQGRPMVVSAGKRIFIGGGFNGSPVTAVNIFESVKTPF